MKRLNNRAHLKLNTKPDLNPFSVTLIKVEPSRDTDFNTYISFYILGKKIDDTNKIKSYIRWSTLSTTLLYVADLCNIPSIFRVLSIIYILDPGFTRGGP